MAAADAKATFAIDLEDGTSAVAVNAAKALADLKGQIDADVKALAGMQRAMKNLQAGSSVNIQQFKDLKAKIDAKKQAIAQAQAAYLSLGGGFDRVKPKGTAVSSLFAQLSAQAKLASGPLGSITARLGGLQKYLVGGAIALGVVALTAALVALAAAAVSSALALTKYGIAQADARRNELLHLEGLTKLRNWWGLAAGNANEMQAAIDRVSGSSATGRAELGRYTDQLYKMGLRGENLTQALEGVAIKAAVQGEAAASAFAGWAAGAAMAGGSVKRLTDDVKARLGGIAAKQLLGLDVQTRKLHESFGALFAGLRIEGFLTALNKVTSLFSQSTASGRALKAVLTSLVQPIVNAFEAAGPIVRRFFQGMILAALDVQIAYFKLKIRIRDAFGDVSLFKNFDTLRAALIAGKAAVYGMLGGLVLLTGIFAAFAVPLAGVATAFLGLGRGLYAFWKFAVGLHWSELGKNIVLGIVSGIGGAAGGLIAALVKLADGGWKAFKTRLGIASPSKEFAKLGRAVPQGVEQGVSQGAPGAQRAVADMVKVPDVPAGKPRAGGERGAAAARALTLTVGDIHVHTTGETAKTIMPDLRAELLRMFEQVAIQLGAPVPGGV